MVIVRTLLRACSAAPLFRLVPTTSMKVLGPCDRQVTTTATPAPSRVPAPPTWGPDVKLTLRPVSVIAKFASFIHSAADLALVSEPTWITGACWATPCVADAIRAKHTDVSGNPARVILRNMFNLLALVLSRNLLSNSVHCEQRIRTSDGGTIAVVPAPLWHSQPNAGSDGA